ncbi:MAG: glutamyl-tRNA(Gln) amidotransferase subunit [Herbaspirillum sp.]|jgi:amidase|nr:glutamyl-tRNA(Gln) amidotransferase subunit [Herbaspirillum sp.]
MNTLNDLSGLSASETARLVRRREISPVETIAAAIERIERRNPSLNALIYTDFEQATQRARALETQIMKGVDPGPLAGVPTAMKDLFDFKPGWPSTFGGVPALKDFIPDFASIYPERIEAAGAILLGKTNSPLLGFRGTTDNPLFGPTRNPFNMSKNSGGSSGGSAAAVADGILPLAGASDAGGSIRIPASSCGVYGFQPSFGRVPMVSRPNAFGAISPFKYAGTVTRTVADAALALGALAGYHPGDPFCVNDTVDFAAAAGRSVRGMKIGFSPDFGGFPVQPEVAALVARAVLAFEEAGATVVPVKIDLPCPHGELTELWCRMICVGTNAVLDGFQRQGIDLLRDHRADLPDAMVEWIERAGRLTVAELNRDQAIRSQVYDALQAAFAQVDLLVTPTLACLPVDNHAVRGNTVGPSSINGEPVDPHIGWCMTYFTNMSGHPAASIPAGMHAGLPVGMQLIGRRLADADVIAASAAFERVRPWRDAYRICAARVL